MLPMRCMTTNDGAGRELASYATIGEKVQQQGVLLQSKVQHDPSWQLLVLFAILAESRDRSRRRVNDWHEKWRQCVC